MTKRNYKKIAWPTFGDTTKVIYLTEYTANLLTRNGVRSLDQLLSMTDSELFEIQGLGFKRLVEIDNALEQYFEGHNNGI